MRRTRLGVLLLATGWACFLLALLMQTLAPALLGVLLIALVLGARPPTPVLKARRIMPESPREGAPLVVTTEVEGPDGVPLFVEDDVPTGASVTSRSSETYRGRGRETLSLQATRPGVLTWQQVRVRYQDPWGLAEDDMSIPLRDHSHVLPDASYLVTRSHLSRPLAQGGRLRSLLAVDTEPEFERLRDWREGDRIRDVDWAHTALLNRLITRETAHAPILPVVLLLHVGGSMRRERRHSKLATAVHAALGVAAAADGARLPVGLVAWSEHGLETLLPASNGRRTLNHTLIQLADLPSGHGWTKPLRGPSAAPDFMPNPGERDYLRAASAFAPSGQNGATPLEAALAAVSKASPQPSLIFGMADFEEIPELASTLARRLPARGHRVVLVALANGAHHYGRGDVDAAAAQELVEWRRHREEARLACERHRVPFIVLGPHLDSRTIQEVVRSAA